MSRENYYLQLEDGLQFQDKVNEYMIKKHNLPIVFFTSAKRQFSGESFNGIEIKYDRRSLDTLNLFIPYKARNKNGNWYDTGLNKNDNTIWFIIGNDEYAYMISKNILLGVIKNLHSVETLNGQGYLLPKTTAENICCLKLNFLNKE